MPSGTSAVFSDAVVTRAPKSTAVSKQRPKWKGTHYSMYTYVIYKDANLRVGSVDRTAVVCLIHHHHVTLFGDLVC